MKTLKRFLFLFAGACLLVSCSKSDDILPTNDPAEDYLKKAVVTTKTVTVPFKAHFTVWDHSDYSDESCGGAPIFFLTMLGEGNINHMGLITTSMTFCLNGLTGEYWDTDCVFVAANGDELYATIPTGIVIPNEEDNSDYYSSRFNDDMYFTGGTGRFEGASGMAKTNAYVHDATDVYKHKGDELWYTDFFSTGELILVKGKH